MAKRSLYYVWWRANYMEPNYYGKTHGAAIVAATSELEAQKMFHPHGMAAGNVWARKLTVEFMDQIGWLEVEE